jgi:hypothetical protein
MWCIALYMGSDAYIGCVYYVLVLCAVLFRRRGRLFSVIVWLLGNRRY